MIRITFVHRIFLDINAVISAFDIDVNDFSLMKAQHVIAKIVGLNSWGELIHLSDSNLTSKKVVLETLNFLIKHKSTSLILSK